VVQLKASPSPLSANRQMAEADNCINNHLRLMLIMARSAERRARFSSFAARYALSVLIVDVSHSAERVTSVTLKIHMYRANPKSAGKEHRGRCHDTSVTPKIHMYRSDTKSRESNIGSDIMIHLICGARHTHFCGTHHNSIRVAHQYLPTFCTATCVTFPTFGITQDMH
jgi:hypothetical protein